MNTKQPKTAVFCYGRFNPPTAGHQKMINYGDIFAKEIGANFYLFPSHTFTPNKCALENKNPLDLDTKLKFLRLFFPTINIISNNPMTLFDALDWLSTNGYRTVYMVTGSDRAIEFKEKIAPYIIGLNPNVNQDKAVDIDYFDVKIAGIRNDKSNNIDGVSGTKAREFAFNGQKRKFNSIIPNGPKNIKDELYNKVRIMLRNDNINGRTNQRTARL